MTDEAIDLVTAALTARAEAAENALQTYVGAVAERDAAEARVAALVAAGDRLRSYVRHTHVCGAMDEDSTADDCTCGATVFLDAWQAAKNGKAPA